MGPKLRHFFLYFSTSLGTVFEMDGQVGMNIEYCLPGLRIGLNITGRMEARRSNPE